MKKPMLDHRRAGVLLQAALLALGLVAAPAVHENSCADVCARHEAATPERHSCGSHAGQAVGHEGCRCLGDCCSIVACCVTPDAPGDAAPPAPLPSPAGGQAPASAPRAPGVWLLPYPTGPPPAA
jgi:hypothetical protein